MRVGWKLRPRKEGGGGWVLERCERRRRDILEGARLRPMRWRDERENVEEKEKRREVERERDRNWRERKKAGVVGRRK